MYLYIQVTDILKLYEVLFCTYCGLFFAFKNSHYPYIHPYYNMHKTLSTLRNEKEQ